MTKKSYLVVGVLLLSIFALMFSTFVACAPADVASRNLSKEADKFEVMRRVIFYNGITDQYILVVEGYCSLGNYDEAGELSVTCRIGKDKYVKHFLGLSDNVTYFAEQLLPETVSEDHYTVFFKPSVLVPSFEIP